MNTVNIDRLAFTLSGILSDRHERTITVTVKEDKNENVCEDRHGDSRFDDYGRRLRTG